MFRACERNHRVRRIIDKYLGMMPNATDALRQRFNASRARHHTRHSAGSTPEIGHFRDTAQFIDNQRVDMMLVMKRIERALELFYIRVLVRPNNKDFHTCTVTILY